MNKLQRLLQDFKEIEYPPRRRQVFEALKELGNATSYELAGFLELPIHVVMPRLTELLQSGMIESVGVQHLNNRCYRVYQVCLLGARVTYDRS